MSKVVKSSKNITLSQNDLKAFEALLESLGSDMQTSAMRYGIACQVFSKVLGHDYDARTELNELEQVALKLKSKIERERQALAVA